MCVSNRFTCVRLCDRMDLGLLASSVHGILQAGILEWIAISSSRGSFRPRDRTLVSSVSCIGRWILYHYLHVGNIDLFKTHSFVVPVSSTFLGLHTKSLALSWVPSVLAGGGGCVLKLKDLRYREKKLLGLDKGCPGGLSLTNDSSVISNLRHPTAFLSPFYKMEIFF